MQFHSDLSGCFMPNNKTRQNFRKNKVPIIVLCIIASTGVFGIVFGIYCK